MKRKFTGEIRNKISDKIFNPNNPIISFLLYYLYGIYWHFVHILRLSTLIKITLVITNDTKLYLTLND